MSMGRPRIYAVNENYFQIIDTPVKAYIVGFLYADGSISDRYLRISIHVKDTEVLELIKTELKYNGPIYNRVDKITGNEYVTLSISSKKICEDLSKIGIIRNKTYVSKSLPVIDNKFTPNMLMGLFDGDGSIYTNQNSKEYTVSYCGNTWTLTEIKDMLQKYNISSSAIRYRRDTPYSGMIEIRGYVNIEKMYHLFYDNNLKYLTRKKSRFNDFIDVINSLGHRMLTESNKNDIGQLYINGMSQAKISRHLNMPASSVRGVIQRLRRDGKITKRGI